ncbi:P-loop containing nucleoside triphosphate hydrolase protein [Mycena vitilis]|nr:P-loop containing nucleoside triphosphate hydrolase protein [Mycena vitilis]
MPRPLTRPRPPVAARPTARGASAPPVSTIRKPSAGVGIGASRVPSSSALGKRTASGSAAAPDVITNLHKRLATLESARTQDTERLATLLESHTTASSSAASSSSTAGAADADAQAAAAAAETHAELLAAQAQLAALTAQISVLSSELSAAKSALRAREESEASLRAETHTLRAETHTLNATILSGRTALARAEDDASALRRALARLEEEGEIRARRAERLLREAKDECEAAEARAGKLRAELGEAVGAETGGRERARVLQGRVEHLGAEVRSLQQENAAANALLREREEERARVEEEREGERRGWAEERAQMREEAGRGEEERRRLHGLVMELKGNIRVFCRVRPLLPSECPPSERGLLLSGEAAPGGDKGEKEGAGADIAYPDAAQLWPAGQKEIVLSAEGRREGRGREGREEWGFGFDRVFPPASTQSDLFAEIAQLAQSCTDGYNVCVFAYGQTGSGKSWTMEGGGTPETQGMIPRAVAQVFRVAEELKDKGWRYTMEGQFLEIYNETITDLLSPPPTPTDPPRKHEIHHHPTTHLTSVSDVLTPALTSPAHVMSLLAQAQSRRRVAATLMNERSSRSHSVFTLKIRGTHSSGEGTRVGTLNLVDLAGSERLASVGHGSAQGGLGASVMGGAAVANERLKETQNINRSLSALGDVIAALGERGPGAHVPYRNSKLTYLLQNSLSGNSKTLMVLNLSPLAAHLNESLTSLRFATKVNNTTIGTAKKVQVQGGKS